MEQKKSIIISQCAINSHRKKSYRAAVIFIFLRVFLKKKTRTKPLKFPSYSVSKGKKCVPHKLLLHSSPHGINFPSKSFESNGETGHSTVL